MSKLMRKISQLIILIIFASVVFTGCTKNNDEHTKALAVVVQNTANSRVPNFNSPKLKEYVQETIRSYGQVSVINLDGEPNVVACDSYDIPDNYKNAADSKLDNDANKKANNILAALSTVKAEAEEVDILESLELARRTMGDLPKSTDKTIYMISTGVSTTGTINFSNNLLAADADYIVDSLTSINALPDLSGITVVWQMLGDVAGSQDELSNGQKKQLESFWRAVIEAAGGTMTITDTLSNPGSNDEGFPAVSTVDIPKESAIVFTGQKSVDLSSPLIIQDDYIGFEPGTAEYRDYSKAEDVLEVASQYMQDHKDCQLLVIGTTAGDELSQSDIDLSKARADRVAQTLNEMGVPAARISTSGSGCNNPWHVFGLGLGSEADCNRTCVLVDAESEIAKSLIT